MIWKSKFKKDSKVHLISLLFEQLFFFINEIIIIEALFEGLLRAFFRPKKMEMKQIWGRKTFTFITGFCELFVPWFFQFVSKI